MIRPGKRERGLLPSEHEIQQRIRLACGRGRVRLWRNNTGDLVDQQGRFGLCKGMCLKAKLQSEALGGRFSHGERLSREDQLGIGNRLLSEP